MDVLLVEDEPLAASALARLLRQHGWRVIAVRSVAEGTGALAAGRFDVAVVDLELPDGCGSSLIERARPIPVVIWSGGADAGRVAHCYRQGARDYVHKGSEGLTELPGVLHRAALAGAPPVHLVRLSVDHSALLGPGDRAVPLGPRMRALVACLIDRAGCWTTAREIAQRLPDWSDAVAVNKALQRLARSTARWPWRVLESSRLGHRLHTEPPGPEPPGLASGTRRARAVAPAGARTAGAA